MKQITKQEMYLLIPTAVVVLLAVIIAFSWVALDVINRSDSNKVDNDYFEKCTFIYETSGGLEIIKKGIIIIIINY